MDQLFDVVANVDDYKYFVPWCVASRTFEQSETHARADLEVGFPPISEKYTSVLTLARPNLVRVRVFTKAMRSCFFSEIFIVTLRWYKKWLLFLVIL